MKEKTKEILNKVINSSFFIIILAIFIILKTILFYKSTVCINEKIDIKTIQSSIIYILSLFGILALLPKKGRNIGGNSSRYSNKHNFICRQYLLHLFK